jgi:hypothetical protein
MFDVERSIAEAEEEFRKLVHYVRDEAQSQDAYTVERHLFRESRRMLLHLLAAYFEQKAGGNVGKAIQTEAGEVLPCERLKTRRYLNVFGELELRRFYYHEDGLSGVLPLDQDTNLPERTYSYLVQELTLQRVGRMTYDEAVAEMENLFGFRPEKHTVEDIAPEIARDVDAYYEGQGTPPPQSEAEILVAAIDGKGVPMLKPEPARHKVRLGRGEKYSHKKEAVVTAVYTVKPHQRTADDIIKEVRDKETPQNRPKPQNKKVRATLQGKQDGMDWVKCEVERRDPQNQKHHVCLMDGSRGLWSLALCILTGFTFILDLFHVLEYLWKAAYVFHEEGSFQAEEFVRHRLRMLLEGKVGYVIGGLQQMLSKHKLNKNQQETLEKVIHYYQTYRKWMCYDQYIAAGFPIGSGAVEGACRHLVKDRMEGTGMRWAVAGAESVLKVRAVYLNGDWDKFWEFHMRCEAQRRFGNRKWTVLPALNLANAAA